MAITRVRGNQISTATVAVITTLSFDATDSVLRLPTGDENQRPDSPSAGTIRFNTTLDSAEIYKANGGGVGVGGWAAVGGGGPSLGEDSVIRTNPNTIDEDLTVGSTAGSEFANGMSAGPITITGTNTVTVEANAYWSIV